MSIKTPIPAVLPVTNDNEIAGETASQSSHIRLPQRSDKVQGNEADVAAVSKDPRTMSQDPPHPVEIQPPSPPAPPAKA